MDCSTTDFPVFQYFSSLLKLMSTESMTLSNHLILRHPFSSCLQSFQPSGSLSVSQFFTSGGQHIGDSASASVPPVNIQGWFSLGMTDLISLLSKGLARVLCSTTILNHQFCGTQPSFSDWLLSFSHIHLRLLHVLFVTCKHFLSLNTTPLSGYTKVYLS